MIKYLSSSVEWPCHVTDDFWLPVIEPAAGNVMIGAVEHALAVMCPPFMGGVIVERREHLSAAVAGDDLQAGIHAVIQRRSHIIADLRIKCVFMRSHQNIRHYGVVLHVVVGNTGHRAVPLGIFAGYDVKGSDAAAKGCLQISHNLLTVWRKGQVSACTAHACLAAEFWQLGDLHRFIGGMRGAHKDALSAAPVQVAGFRVYHPAAAGRFGIMMDLIRQEVNNAKAVACRRREGTVEP